MDGSNLIDAWRAAGDARQAPSASSPAAATATAVDDGPARPAPPSGGTAHGLGDPAAPSFESRAIAAAEKFESFFIAQMLRQMRSGANQFADEGSAAKDPLNADMLSLADGLLADSLAGRHAFGIADAILRQLTPEAGQAVLHRPGRA